ncbi:MAG: sugar phosphate isomerase/epimerase [Anaerocolumna sp.]|jgi:sugar phosphate isomerase/epimerase|nr:sugar phosphate isomerase/epimerase [Anaerocolumna sp.]
MAVKAIQQFQLRTVIGSEKQAKETLERVKTAGYEGIELCGFMIKKMPMIVRILTRLAGMSMGKSGNLDWKKLISESGLKVVSVHEDLGSILRAPNEIIKEAKSFNTGYVVVTGMHHFDYSDKSAVLELVEKLNKAGKLLKEEGISFLYHNHNCEFRKVESEKTAYDLIIEKTNPEYVNFEFDSYWPTEAGVDALALMEKLGKRMKLYHINDRGSRVTGKKGSILKSDSMELGFGNMNLTAMVETAKKYGVEAVILESHKNWVDKSPIKSFQLSAEFMNRYI